MSTRIAIIIPYFGPWPEWINFFVESCRSNSKIDWILFSDQEPPANKARNVRQIRMNFADYKSLISRALGIRFNPDRPYKICDVRPALPLVHRDLVGGYDFVGTGDLDVVYGNLTEFYNDDVLSRYDLISSHQRRVSGHLCLMRNAEEMVTAFKRANNWKAVFERPSYVGFDESGMFKLLRGRSAKLATWLGRRQPRCFFHEAYSTPAAGDRACWYWRAGQLTNDSYPHHPFAYLHFMNWHSNRWYAAQPGVVADTPAPWTYLPAIVQMDWRDARRQGFMISTAGIQPIEERPLGQAL